VPLSPPTFAEAAAVVPVAYGGGIVLMTVGEGAAQRSALWEAGDDAVVAILDGTGAVVGGANASFSRNANAVGGRAVFRVAEDHCRYEVRELRDGDGSPWRLCREPFVAFSPDGNAVLATDALSEHLVVRRASDGKRLRTFDVGRDTSAYGWEDADSVVFTCFRGASTLITRCSVSSGGCRQAAELPGTERIPQRIRRVG
jgi:hypothetical protein